MHVSRRREPHEHLHSVRVLHTSDVHIGTGHHTTHGELPEHSLAVLEAMADLGNDLQVDLVVIAGDFFDHNRVRESLVAETGRVLGAFHGPVVILPGNHDPYTADSPYARHAVHFPANVHVFRAEEGELITLPDQGVQVWGQAHANYYDFRPAATPPAWFDDLHRPHWRIAMAHGYYVKSDYELKFSFQIHPHELEALGAHYVALGHLEQHGPVGPAQVTAFYSGEPTRHGAFTLVDLTPDGVVVREVSAPRPAGPAVAHADPAPLLFPGAS